MSQTKKSVLITGANSYIGESVKRYLEQYPELYDVDIIDTIGLIPTSDIFYGYDVVFNAAGIAHIKETDENRHLYYDVNRDLAIQIAEASKSAGVKQLILLSSMSVYGLTVGYIKKDTVPKPVNAYGKSKLEADEAIRMMEDDQFKFACLRPPMVYGKGCKGNYQSLRKFALHFPLFPSYPNHRSMVYIGNLCEFVKQVIDFEKSGLFFPQNAEYVNTSEMVNSIAEANAKKMHLTKFFNFILGNVKVPVIQKVFGNLIYESVDRVDKYGFSESVEMTER